VKNAREALGEPDGRYAEIGQQRRGEASGKAGGMYCCAREDE